MTPFITQVLQELLQRKRAISDYIFVLPSKRAGSFLINQLSKLTLEPIFAPKIFSIEDFATEISGTKTIENTVALFEFYSVYLKCTPEENIENFETFSSWAQTLLYDFNEIDRYLIDHKSFFGYLSEIQEVNHWYLQPERTPLMENYLSFWRKLPEYYEELKKELLSKNVAYQGMVYRQASEKVEEYIQKCNLPHIFIGFNALNTAEQNIIQKMLKSGKAEVFWDIDEAFLNDPKHEASLFIRQYRKNWPFYSENELNKISTDFSSEKDIKLAGIPKNIGQAKYVGELLSSFSAEELKETAVVLGDESLLLPVLNSLPPNIQEVNVTMGFPLKYASVTALFEQLLKMHSNFIDTWYYKDIIAVSDHPLVQKATRGASKILSGKIQKENLIYLSPGALAEIFPENYVGIFQRCFQDWQNSPAAALENLQKFLLKLKENLDKEHDKLPLEFLYQFHLLLNTLHNLIKDYPHLNSIKSLFSIFKDLLNSQTVDFRGQPFKGLQIMGMLESRVLDFKNVIITSVNEGVLPAGKSSNSFIPYDLKCAYKLPTYKEKDAVYTYHFYHLLQRSQQVHILYNTETDGLNGGEKSRFLLQLEMEKKLSHHISNLTVAPRVPAIQIPLRTVKKNAEIMEVLKKRAEKGFSPSALTTYIRNPLDFYHQYVLGIREREEIEETIAYNTLGTVVHQSLENFFKVWKSEELSIENLQKAIKNVPVEVALQFENEYSKEPLSQGKNLLIFEVAKRYVTNFLKAEINILKAGNTVKIIEIESRLRSELSIPELDFPVFIHGNVDRVDEFNGTTRIIDYKTGKVEQKDVELEDWDDLNTDYDRYSKSFQVLTYAFMINGQNPLKNPTEAGIISFKNMKNGFLRFTKKDRSGPGAIKSTCIDQDVLEAFEEQLKKLIIEICDPEIPFQEKEIKKKW